MATALEVSLEGKISKFEQAMKAATTIADLRVKQIEDRFKDMNKNIAGDMNVAVPALKATTAIAVGLIALTAGFAALSSIIKSTREELGRLIEIGDKAEAAGVGSRFFQAFTEGARKATDSAKEFEGFLSKAFDATKTKLGQENEIVKRLSALSGAGFNSGMINFSAANTQEERVMSVLRTMQELEKVGQRLAALDLAEAMFGSAFSDRLRTGKDTIDATISRLESAMVRAQAGKDFLPQDQIERAQKLNEQLAEAHRIIDQNMKPSWDALRDIMLDIKNVWVIIVRGIAAVTAMINQVQGISLGLAGELTAIPAVLRVLKMLRENPVPLVKTDPLGSPDGSSKEDRAKTNRLELTDKTNTLFKQPVFKEATKEAEEQKDAFDKAVDSLNRHAAAMMADAETAGMNRAAQEQLRAEMKLLEAARTSGTEITDEQVAAYVRLRKEMSAEQALTATGITLHEADAEGFRKVSERIYQAADASAHAKYKFQELQSASREFGSALSTAFKDLVLNGKSALEVLGQLLNRLASKGIDKLFDMFFGAPAGGGFSPFLSMLGFGGARAAGGPVERGKWYMVGENGPEPFIPRQDGYILPNGARPTAGGGQNVSMTLVNDFRGADPSSEGHIMRRLDDLQRAIPGMVVSTIRSARRHSVRGV